MAKVFAYDSLSLHRATTSAFCLGETLQQTTAEHRQARHRKAKAFSAERAKFKAAPSMTRARRSSLLIFKAIRSTSNFDGLPAGSLFSLAHSDRRVAPISSTDFAPDTMIVLIE